MTTATLIQNWYKYSDPDGQAVSVRLFEQSVVIERLPEEVFAFVSDFENDTRWTPQIEEMHKTSEGPLGVGTTFEAVFRLLGRRLEVVLESTEYDEPNRKLTFRPTSGPLQITAMRSVEAVPGGARFTITLDGRTGGFFWPLPDQLFAWLLPRQLNTPFDRLKTILEATSAEPEPAGPVGAPPERHRLLPLVSVLWLLNSAVGAAVAIREDLPGEFAGMTRW